MTDVKHTPGPWSWTDGYEPIDIAAYKAPGYYRNPELKGSNGDDVVGCDEYWIIGPCTDDAVMRANARLIAAAPDLLEALEPFGEIDGEGDEDFADDTPVIVKFGRSTNYTLTLGHFRRARAAIAQAEGVSSKAEAQGAA